MSKCIAIIPARMASSRFPGKPLKQICGISMIEHVRRRTLLCKVLDDVIVATCDEEIAMEVKSFNGKVIMTSDRHESCVDRVAEAAQELNADIIINVQGDMPLVDPKSLEQLIMPLIQNDTLKLTDMMGEIIKKEELDNPNVVKVVADLSGNALYYSREAIPSSKKTGRNSPLVRFKQFGINAYRSDALRDFTRLPRTDLEKIESVDMLRLLDNGFPVRMVICTQPIIGVDTQKDLLKVEQLMEKDELFRQYRTEKNEHIYRT